MNPVVMVGCGACGVDNHPDARFCKSCGQNLFERCSGCGKQVSLSQRFCASCGADLDKALQVSLQRHEQALVEAVASARDYDFDHAIALLSQVAALKDYRFQEVAQNAKQAIGKVETLRARAIASADEALARAKTAFERGDQGEVVRILEAVPAKMLGEPAKKILARVKSYTSEVTDLVESLKTAMAHKNWPAVGSVVDQLLIHLPEDKQYVQLAQQVTVKLYAAAKQMFACGRYSDAVENLAAIPNVARDNDYQRFRQQYEDVDWLSRQFDREAFVTPMLGRLAVRFAKEVPQNNAAQSRVNKLASRLKSADRSNRNPYPTWRQPNVSWMGCDVDILGVPQAIDLGDQKLLKGCIGRFHVALGLALQGLGHGRVAEQLAPKKGLLTSLSWRKSKRCWGIDIGSASLKAVCLVEGEEGVKVEDCYYHEFPDPVCRFGVQAERSAIIEAAIEKLIEEKELGDTPVWVNLGGAELINRFVRLPPVSDKQANVLLDLEIDQRIPIDREDLAIVRWVGEVDEDEVHGRPAMLTAAKRASVEKRLEELSEAGLKVSGLQGDAVAVANFIVFEFAELLQPEPEEEADQQETDDDEVTASEQDEDLQMRSVVDPGTPTIAVVECGAETTSLILVSTEAHWIWTIENGGEDLTAALARKSKITHGEAEKQKRNPAEIPLPSKNYAFVEQRLDEFRMRMQRVFDDALQQNERFRVSHCWCMGGGCLAHQWLSRLILDTQSH